MQTRDPLSVRYDATVRRALLAAIAAHARNARTPRRVSLWVHSPAPAFRNPDAGGMTANERAFQRAVYYQTWRVPINAGVTPDWSARLDWGKVQLRRGRWGRNVSLRLFLYRSGRAYAARRIPKPDQWREDIAGGETRSIPGARVDEGRND